MDVKKFLFSLPQRADAAALEGVTTRFHFVLGEGDTDKYTVNVDDGRLDVSEGLQGDPSCTVTTTPEVFSKLLSGDLNPMMAMMTGKLKISNPGEMLKYAKMFGLM